MIAVESIAKSFGGQVLFRDLSWRIADRERIGLVGPNGAGKTTLCRILAGLDDPDVGRVSRPRATTVGYLAQEAAASGEGSVLAEALAGFADVWALERDMEDVAAALATAPTEALTARYGDLQHRFEALGGYTLDQRVDEALSGLGFTLRNSRQHRTGDTVNASSNAPPRAKAYVSAIGPKIWPSGPVMVKRGKRAQTMMSVAKNRLLVTSPHAARIRSRVGRTSSPSGVCFDRLR